MRVPTYAGTLEGYTLSGDPLTPRAPRVPLTRTAFAAARLQLCRADRRRPHALQPRVARRVHRDRASRGAGAGGAGRRRHAPTVPLSREIFKAPTRFYKAGIAFLAWLNGAQSHFIMPGGFQSSREITHYAEVFRLAYKARVLTQPDLAVERMAVLLRLHGID